MPKPLNKQWRWRVEAKPEKGSTWTRLGRDHYAQSIIRATFLPLTPEGDTDENGPIVKMLVGLDNNKKPQVWQLIVDASRDEPLTPNSTRLPLRAMSRAAVASLSYRGGDSAEFVALPGDTFTIDNSKATVEHLAPERLVALERDAQMRPRSNPVTDDVYERVAAIVMRVPYRERREAVMREFDVSYPTAKSWIAKTRKRGLIHD